MLTLRHPAGVGSGGIVLPSPLVGDTLTTDTRQLGIRSRHGDLYVVYDTNWEQTTTRVFAFEGVTETVKDDLVDFLTATAGLEVELIDHLDDSIVGYITTPVTDIVTKKDVCNYELSFEFEEKVT